MKSLPFAIAFAAFLFALHPTGAFADVPAGFAPGSLWLSKTEVTAGESLKIFTVLYDSASSSIEGDVEFTVDEKSIGSEHFKLAAGETQILSHDWAAVAGAHSFGATLKNVTGLSGIASTQTNVVSITVNAAEPSPITKISNTVSGLYASSSPAVQNIVQKVVGTTEGVRARGASWLSNALYTDQSLAKTASTSPAGEVLGVQTYRAPTTTVQSGLFGSLKHWVLVGLLSVFSIRWLFYAALLTVIYVLYKVIQGFFRYRER